MGRPVIDLSGCRFGRLTVVRRACVPQTYSVFWLCRCDCGELKIVQRSNLKFGTTQSCGCYGSEVHSRLYTQIGHLNRKHGETNKTPEYLAWSSMKRRCTNPNAKGYHNYGGRGISVCTRWLTSFTDFLSDMGRKPSSQYSIDRINNDGNYEPNNCRWADAKTQAANRRT